MKSEEAGEAAFSPIFTPVMWIQDGCRTDARSNDEAAASARTWAMSWRWLTSLPDVGGV